MTSSIPTGFYVYEHWRPDTNTCFYVGKGKGERAFLFKRHKNRHYNRIANKLELAGLSVEVRIYKDGLAEEDAYRLEMERIAFYGRDKLTNLTDGGEGCRNMSAESRAKISEAGKGKIRHAMPHSEKTKNRLRELGRINYHIFLRYQSMGPKSFARKVLCVSDNREFNSASEASREYGVCKSAIIELCLGQRGRKTVGGRVFRYIEDAS